MRPASKTIVAAVSFALVLLLAAGAFGYQSSRRSTSELRPEQIERLASAPLNTRLTRQHIDDVVGLKLTLSESQRYGHNKKFGILDVGWVRLVSQGHFRTGWGSGNDISVVAEWTDPTYTIPPQGESGEEFTRSSGSGDFSTRSFENGYTEIQAVGLDIVIHNGELKVKGRSYPLLGPDVCVVFFDEQVNWLFDIRRPESPTPASSMTRPTLCDHP